MYESDFCSEGGSLRSKSKKIHSQLFPLSSNGKPPQIILWPEALFFGAEECNILSFMDLCMMQMQVMEPDWNKGE